MGERILYHPSVAPVRQESSSGVSYAELPCEERISLRLGELMASQAVLQGIPGLEVLSQAQAEALKADVVLDTIVDCRGKLAARTMLKSVRAFVNRSGGVNNDGGLIRAQITTLMESLSSNPEPKILKLPDIPHRT